LPPQTCAIWGDTNGGERNASFVGEAALATGELTFGYGAVNGTTSHETNDVLYVAFQGDDAVPGPHGAAWDAKTKEEFEESIEEQCLRVAAKIGGKGSGGSGDDGDDDGAGGGGAGPKCSWDKHCAGMSCRVLEGFGLDVCCSGTC
jgi:hypothetical protein